MIQVVVELSDTNFLESVIENVGNKVVSNGASIETLKSKSVGISSCVTSIQDALDSNSDSDISTKILEMHKTKKAVRETIRGGGINFSSSISSHISTRRSILNLIIIVSVNIHHQLRMFHQVLEQIVVKQVVQLTIHTKHWLEH